MTGPLRVLSLCSGAVDGLGLAAEAAGMEIAALCEIDPWCRQALAHHFPERMIYHDVRDVTRDRLRRDGVGPIDVLVAGPPCQDVSHAGRRRGAQGDRWLWPEVLGVVSDLEPRWVCFENPLGLRTVGARREFGALLATLATLGYRVGYDQWGAADVGAPHQRERVFIIARRATRAVGDADGLVDGRAGHDPAGGVGQEAAGPPGAGPDTLRRSVACAGDPGAPAGAGAAGPLADAQSARWPLRGERGGGSPTEPRPERHGDPDNATAERAAQPGVGLPADGPAAGLVRFPGWPAPPGEAQRAYEPPRLTTSVKGRPKMLHALGNSVLWRQAYPIFRTIVEVEEGAVTPWTP